MRSTTRFALASGAALVLGLAGAAGAHPGYGPGAGCGWGAASGMGYGHQMGPGYGRGMGPGMGPGYGTGPGEGMGPGHGMGRGFGMAPGGLMQGGAAAVAERLDGLKTTLGITDKQQPAWDAFAGSVKKRAEDREAWFDRMRDPKAARTAPEWHAERLAAMKQHQAAMEAVTSALSGLYEVLTPEQRATLDRQHVAQGPRHGWRER